MSILASAQVTLAWSAGIVATVRYYQMAAPTAATPTVPTSSGALGSWSDTEPAADVTKVLWTCERTVYADGTESWSKASKSTSYEAAKDAKSTATDAQSKVEDAQVSITRLDSGLASEVKARAKTDGAVSELSSKIEQTVNGINVSLDKLTETDKHIRSWFDFGTDSSGNPKLAMGSSSFTPIVGEYSNTGATYKDRSGATLLALDAASSTTGADHVVSNDVTIGRWQWVPTNNGTHLTLMWRG